jgi:hypothetical protein
MLKSYRLLFYLLFLAFDKLVEVLLRFLSFLCFWIVTLVLIPFFNSEEMHQNLMGNIKSLDK